MAASFVIAPTGAYVSYTSADDYAARGHPLALSEARHLVRVLQDERVLAPGASVLDLGCGAGFLLEEAARISPAGRHYGGDAFSNMTLIAMRHLRSACGSAAPKVRRADVREPQQLRAVLRGPDAPH